MNAHTATKYQEVDALVKKLGSTNAQIDQNMLELLPLMKEIDDIEQTVAKLEGAAYRLDSYTSKLENQFKTVFPNKK